MMALRRRAPVLAPSVSRTAVGKTSVVANRPPVIRRRNGSSFQLRCRETNVAARVAASAAYARANHPGSLLGSTVRSAAGTGSILAPPPGSPTTGPSRHDRRAGEEHLARHLEDRIGAMHDAARVVLV